MQERRGIVRWPLSRQTKVKLRGAEAFIDCVVKDINLKGLQLALGMKLPKDSFVSLSLVLSSEFTLFCEVWVAWHKVVDGRNVYGLYFTKIKDGDKEFIYKLLRQHIPHEINRRWWAETREEGEAMAGENFEDRRIFERFHVNLPVRFLDTGSSQENCGRIFDISAKGIGLVTKEKLPVNTSLEMWLEVPDKGEPLYSRGEIVWSKSSGLNENRSGVSLEKADLMGLGRVLRAAQ